MIAVFTRALRLFLTAVQFLTRLPTLELKDFQPDWIARPAPFYPVVGWIVGAICGVVLLSAAALWPPLVSAALAVGAGLLVTGGFHEDGLADTADGLGGGQTPARRLEIMKDSRLGSYGALALWAVLTAKVAALSGLAPLRAALALVLAHGAARAVSVLVMAFWPYAGDPLAAKLKPAPTGVRPWDAALAVLAGFGALYLFAPWPQACRALTLALGAGFAVAFTAKRLIGGWTGDVLGAAEQVAELGLILGLSAAVAA